MSVRVTPTKSAFTAGADLSSSRYLIVKLNGTANEVDVAGAAEQSIGGLTNAPASGKSAEVVVAGGTYAIAGGVIAIGTKVTATAAGKLVAATATQFYLGRTIGAAAADGDEVEIIIEKGFVPA